MKFSKYIFLLFLTFGVAVNASQRKVLIEIFTNAHCPLCPPAHIVLEDYMQNGQNKDHVTYIFYHMAYPYPDDPINNANPDDPYDRDNYYQPQLGTPACILDGAVQYNEYTKWVSLIDARAAVESPLEITLEGTTGADSATVTAKIKQTGTVNAGNLVICFVAVENINYRGRNGISDHKFAMRKMFPNSSGQPITLSLGQTVDADQTMEISSDWNTSQLGFVVFVQDRKTKTVLQSEFISYGSLSTTGVETSRDGLPSQYLLSQNYPNPFNPSTIIRYQIAPSVDEAHVTLKIYDMLGRETATLVNEVKKPGSYEVKFDGSGLSSGLYFYSLRTNGFVLTRKMLLLK